MNCCVRCARVIIIALPLVLGSTSTFASEVEHHAKHMLGPFVGITREHGHNRYTAGIEYSYRVNQTWSVGAVIERAERDNDSMLTNIFAHVWPFKGLYFGFGVGRKDPGDERENLLRGTIGYEFELRGGWGISPQFNLDLIQNEENEEVYGVVIGKRF